MRESDMEWHEIPEKLETPEACLAAARSNGYALEYVPEALRQKIRNELGL